MNQNQSELVLIDSSVWIQYLNVRVFPGRNSIDRLMSDDTACVNGVIKAEVLLGSKTRNEFSELGDILGGVIDLPTNGRVWNLVAELAFELKLRGEMLPIPDLIIAATAIGHGCWLYTLDKGFARITELRFYDPT